MKLIKRSIDALTLQRTARLYIGLPDDYDSSKERYPVLYMQDGHNVFLKEDSFIGQTWEMLQLYQNNKDLPKIIVVALDSSQKEYGRIDEYSPYQIEVKDSYLNHRGGKGDLYLSYMIETIKPLIDNEFRTLTDAKDTAIMGSSLGGLMSLYACLKYPRIFSKCASLSGSFFVSLDKMIDLISKSEHQNINKIYIDTGDAEIAGGGPQDYLESNRLIYQELAKHLPPSTLIYEVVKDGKHSEVDWAKRLKTVILHLFGKKKL